MECTRCHKDFPEDRMYSYQGKPYCDDCLMEIGLHKEGCDPWETYAATRPPLKGMVSLTETQQKIYDFVKDQGRATRDEVKAKFNLSEAEMDAQLTPLMNSEKIKEHSEGGQFYLIPVA